MDAQIGCCGIFSLKLILDAANCDSMSRGRYGRLGTEDIPPPHR
jgi:hypothetical protein